MERETGYYAVKYKGIGHFALWLSDFKIRIIKILVLAFSFTASAQQFTPDGKYYLMPIEQVPIIANDLKYLRHEVDTLRIMVKDCSQDVINMELKYNESEAKRETLRQERDNALEEAWKMEKESAVLRSKKPSFWSNKWLWFGIGFAAGSYGVIQISN